MWSITRGMMKRSRRTLVPAGIAIAIASLFISATLLLGNVLDAQSVKQFTAEYGNAEYSATPDYLTSPSYQSDGDVPTLASTGLEDIASVNGVSDVRYAGTEPVIASAGAASSASSAASSGYSASGIEVSTKAGIMPIDLTDGSWPSKPGEAALDSDLASKLGVSVGGTVSLVSTAVDSAAADDAAAVSPLVVRVTGLTDDPHEQYSLAGGSVTLAADDIVELERQNLLAIGTPQSDVDSFTHGDITASAVYFSLDSGMSDSQKNDAIGQIRSKLRSVTVTSRTDAADAYLRKLNGGGVNPVVAAILVFAILAMFVAALVIANTFRVLVTQRRRTLALLRTIGASKGQVHRSVLTEGVVLGLEYSVLGTALAYAIVAILAAAKVQGIELIPSASSILVPIVFATLITVLASSGAARLATSVTPMEALRPIDATEKAGIKAARAVVSVLLLAGGLALCLSAVRMAGRISPSSNDYATPLLMAVPGCILVFIGLVMSTQAWIPWLLSGLGRLVSLTGASGTIAAANIRKNPRRIAATSGALLIGITLVATVATGASCASATVNRELDSHYSVDASITEVAADPAQIGQVKALDGVSDAQGIAAYAVTLSAKGTVPDISDADDAQSYTAMYVIPDSAIGSVVSDTFGTRHLEDGVVYVSDAMHATKPNTTPDVRTGDSLGMVVTSTRSDQDSLYATAFEGGDVSTIPQAQTTLPVRTASFAIGDDDCSLAISEGTARSLGIDPGRHDIWIGVDKNADASDLIDRLTTLTRDFNGSNLTGAFIFRKMFDTVIDIAMKAMLALLSVAVIIALVGVANTLSLSVIERQRESATLRAIGMTSGQLRASLAWESVLISVGAGLAGLVTGGFFGWVGAVTLLTGTSVAFAPNWAIYGGIVLLSLVAALLASVLPARRATKVPPVVALADAD